MVDLNSPAIVIVTGRNGVVYDEPYYHGVFASGESACRWAIRNCPDVDWHWQNIALQINDDGSARIE